MKLQFRPQHGCNYPRERVAALGAARYVTTERAKRAAILGSTYYAANSVNTANACESCQPSGLTTDWTTLSEGANCGTAGAGTVCHNGTCQTGCYIGLTYYAANAVNAANACQTCESTVSTTSWTTSDAASCGCSGSLETVQSSTGLCVAKMAEITAPTGDSAYNIDVTEVTKFQYDSWLGTNPALPAASDANCGWKLTGSYAEQGTYRVYTGADAAHHPVVYVDWCDAYAYCKGVGKRLCGAIGGGSNAYASYADATDGQWYRACSSGGVNSYPYGTTYQETYCNGYDYWNDNSTTMQTVVVGSLANCVTSATGYAGVYDLSGNVYEWEDSCSGTGQSALCHILGGAFNYTSASLTCGGTYNNLNSGYYNIGFRCCSP